MSITSNNNTFASTLGQFLVAVSSPDQNSNISTPAINGNDVLDLANAQAGDVDRKWASLKAQLEQNPRRWAQLLEDALTGIGASWTLPTDGESVGSWSLDGVVSPGLKLAATEELNRAMNMPLNRPNGAENEWDSMWSVSSICKLIRAAPRIR